MKEAASLAPLFAGVSYEHLEGWNSQVWPVAPDGQSTPLLYENNKFAFPDAKARLFFPSLGHRLTSRRRSTTCI